MHRRHFLRGLGGIALALPFLESMAPRRIAAAPPTAPKRFVIVFQMAGVQRERFYPKNHGALTAASLSGTSLEPLASFATKLLIPRGIRNWPNENHDAHQQAMVISCTASPLRNGGATGPSVDQVIAQQINPPGRPAMGLHVGAYEKSLRGTPSWAGAGKIVLPEANPWNAFRDFVGLPADPRDDQAKAALARLVKKRESVLDLVRDRVDELGRSGLSAADRQKLDLHFTTVRGIETGIASTGMGPSCSPAADLVRRLDEIKAVPVMNDDRIGVVSRLHLDVLALALACDHTRVGSMIYGTAGGGSTYRIDGLDHDRQQHAISHREGPNPEERLAALDRWHATQVAHLLAKLEAFTEPGGTVLDNSAIVWTNELDHGNAHNASNMPYVIAGGCGGTLKTGRHFVIGTSNNPDREQYATNARLWTTMINACGGKATAFGVDAGRFEGELPELRG
jgi:hypothetical protein